MPTLRRFTAAAALAVSLLVLPGCLPTQNPLDYRPPPTGVDHWVYFPDEEAYYSKLHEQFWVREGDRWVPRDAIPLPPDARAIPLERVAVSPYLYFHPPHRMLLDPRAQAALPARFRHPARSR